MWIAEDYGTQIGTITFELATAVTDDGEGGVASGVSSVKIPVRVKVISQGQDRARVLQVFPGTNSYQVLFSGWVGHKKDHKTYKFPPTLRNWQESPVGTFEYTDEDRNSYSGKIEVNVQPFTIGDAASQIGERFDARFTPG